MSDKNIITEALDKVGVNYWTEDFIDDQNIYLAEDGDHYGVAYFSFNSDGKLIEHGGTYS